MNYSLGRALLSQPEGIPSLVDIWYFVSFLAVTATVFAFFLNLKKKGSDNYRICGFIIGFLILAMFVLYDPFLVAKSKSLLKAILSTWLRALKFNGTKSCSKPISQMDHEADFSLHSAK